MATMEREQLGAAMARLWWMWLVTGIICLLVSVTVLQFSEASAAVVGIIFGVMLFVAGLQYLVIGTLAEGYKWLWYGFGGLFVVGGVLAMFYPVETFLNLADVLGFLFVLIGAMWIVEGLVSKEVNPLWWLGFASGIVMALLGFWLGGQFLITKAYTLLVFTGAYALMKGIADIVLAFQIRRLGKLPTDAI